jgi:signal transduction histidine kinase
MAKSSWLCDEIHDLIGHKLSLMVLHASALELAGGPNAERAVMIRQTGHDAIVSLREILSRMADDHVPAQRTGTRPSHALRELVTQSRDAGLPIDLHTGPGLDRLPPAAAELLCDVTREALTNVHKHAGVVPTTVTAEVLNGRLMIDVSNQRPQGRPATAGTGSNRGLRGLRRRLAHHGGQVTHETTPGGGFRLCAQLPLSA